MTTKERLRSSGVYLPLARRKYGRERIVDAGTDLVIEGYPRSANTYAVEAFRLANPDLRLAHHVHSAAQVTAAVRLGVPCLVLIRDPREAIASWMVYEHTTADRALDRWLWFHQPLMAIADRFVLADFPDVTRSFGQVIARVNARYGTSFAATTPGAEEREQIFAGMGDHKQWGDQRRVPRPSAERDELKERAAEELAAPEYFEDLSHAVRMWSSLLTEVPA